MAAISYPASYFFISLRFPLSIPHMSPLSRSTTFLLWDCIFSHALWWYVPHARKILFNQSNIKIVLSDDPKTAESYKDLEGEPTALFLLMDKLNIPESLQMQNFIAVWSVVHGLAGIVTMKGVEFDGDWNTMIERILTDNLALRK